MLHVKLKLAKDFIARQVFRLMPDYLYLKIWYKKRCGYFPDLKNPKTFNEKIQWYKLYCRKTLFTQISDKLAVRDYVSSLGLSHILNDLYGTYGNPNQIDFNRLPDRFVLKVTHGCGMNIICKDKSKLDQEYTIKQLGKWLKTNHYIAGREWAYKNIKPKIICEKFLENKEHNDLLDYKFYCFNGEPIVVFVCEGRFSEEGVRYTAYDMNWNITDIFKGKPGCKSVFKKPDNFSEMVNVTKKLCPGFPFVRVDLYSVQNKVIFSELTLYPDAGYIPFTPEKYNTIFGDLFQLQNCLG